MRSARADFDAANWANFLSSKPHESSRHLPRNLPEFDISLVGCSFSLTHCRPTVHQKSQDSSKTIGSLQYLPVARGERHSCPLVAQGHRQRNSAPIPTNDCAAIITLPISIRLILVVVSPTAGHSASQRRGERTTISQKRLSTIVLFPWITWSIHSVSGLPKVVMIPICWRVSLLHSAFRMLSSQGRSGHSCATV